MKKRNLVLGAVLLLASLLLSSTSLALADSPSNTDNPNPCVQDETQITGDGSLLTLMSDERAKELARTGLTKEKGDEIVSRMINRVIPGRYESIEDIYFTKTPTPVQTGIWVGYSAYKSSGSIQQVNASFNVVPSSVQDATWTGINGSANQLAQTGVTMWEIDAYDTYLQRPVTDYFAWYDFLPNEATWLFGVDPGDTMYGSVAWIPTTQAWYVLIVDETSGLYCAYQRSYTLAATEAVWMVERIGASYGTFNKVDFSNCQWLDASYNWQNINSDADTTLYAEIDNGVTLSCIGADGKSFSMKAPGQHPGTYTYPASQI